MKKNWLPQAIVIPMLLWALIPVNPYGYYVLLRWICCAVFVYLAFRARDVNRPGWVWVLGVIAAVYNPIFRVHSTQVLWSVVNLVTIGLAIASYYVLNSNGSETGK